MAGAGAGEEHRRRGRGELADRVSTGVPLVRGDPDVVVGRSFPAPEVLAMIAESPGAPSSPRSSSAGGRSGRRRR